MNKVSLRYVIAPAKPLDIIYRQVLCEKLLSNISKSLIILNTSAGYGKTVLLSDYSTRFLKNVCWLNSPAGIDTPSELTLYLIHSVRELKPGFGEGIIDFISSITSEDKKKLSADMVILFLNELIESFEGRVTFIIDDFQNLEENQNTEWLQIFFNELFISLPQNLNFIILTRQTPCFKISRLEAKRDYFALSTKDLAFSEDEIMTLAREVYNIKCSVDSAEQLKNLAKGWITLIHLIVQTVKSFDELPGYNLGENIFNYFTEDIFNYLDDEIKQFLLSTAFLDSFTTDFCNKLLDINNSDEIIGKIISKNVFIDTFKNVEEISFSYQKLFSDFLREYSKRTLNNKDIEKLFLKAARIYKQDGNNVNAVNYFIKSGSEDEAVKIINENFESKLENSEYKILNDWFSILNKDVIASDAVLQYNYIKFCLAVNRLEDTLPKRIEHLIKSVDEDNELYIKYALLKSEYNVITGDTSKSVKILEKLAKNNIKGRLTEEYYVLLVKTYYRVGFDYYEKLIQISEHVLEIIRESGTNKQKLEVLGFLANIYADKGQKELAIKFYEQSIPMENIFSAFKVSSTLISLYSEIGNFDKSQKYLQSIGDIFLKIPIPFFERLLLRAQALFYFNLGDFTTEVKILNQIIKISVVNTNRTMLQSYYLQIVEGYYYSCDKNLASQNYVLSKKYLDKKDDYFTKLDGLFLYYYIAENINSDETGNAILSLISYQQEKQVYSSISSLQYYLANHYLSANNPVTSLEYLQKAMKTFTEKNDLVWCSNEFIITRHVFDFAIANNVCKPFISKIFPFILSKLDYKWIRPEFRIELTGKIEKLIDVKMESFGKTDFYLRGNIINNDKWIRKKSKILLAYLMSGYEKVYTKDKIVEMFFDDVPAEKADVMYHSTIYNIRTALKVYDLKAGKSKGSKLKDYDYNPEYILYEDKTLRLNPDFYYRSDNIEFEKLYSKAKLPSENKESKINFYIQAVELYKGDFLPGYYDSWCEELREKYKNMFITLSEDLIKLLEADDRIEEIIKFSEKLLAEDPLNESVYISLINSYTTLQNLNMAKNIFSQMLKVYDKELGEKPSDKTLQKINSILQK